MIPKKTTSESKRKWLLKRAKSLGGLFVADTINKNQRAKIFYRDALQKQYVQYVSKAIRELKKEYRSLKLPGQSSKSPNLTAINSILSKFKNSYANVLLNNGEKIIYKWLRLVALDSKKSLQRVLGDFLGKQPSIRYDQRLYESNFKIYVRRNVELIKNTTSQTISNIEQIVYDGMTTGEGWKDIEDKLQTQIHIATDRAKRIARDQTAKANEALNGIAQQAAGGEFWMWDCILDERTSTGKGGHRQLHGKIYSYRHPETYPVIDSYGHIGEPAERPLCRCTKKLVFILDGWHAQLESDGSYTIRKDNRPLHS